MSRNSRLQVSMFENVIALHEAILKLRESPILTLRECPSFTVAKTSTSDPLFRRQGHYQLSYRASTLKQTNLSDFFFYYEMHFIEKTFTIFI